MENGQSVNPGPWAFAKAGITMTMGGGVINWVKMGSPHPKKKSPRVVNSRKMDKNVSPKTFR